jgi:hypothetical protein
MKIANVSQERISFNKEIKKLHRFAERAVGGEERTDKLRVRICVVSEPFD